MKELGGSIMNNIKLQLMDRDQKLLKERQDDDGTFVEYHHRYIPGDFYRVTVDKAPCYLIVQLDLSVKPALLYIPEKTWDYQIPVNNRREWPYSPLAFQTRNNYAMVRYAYEGEIASYRNLAENSYDQHDKNTGFPHATANAETRGENVFYCKNAIDGICANSSHGNYPYQSWGTNGQKDAEMTLDYGREVEIDNVVLTLRADYPHDGYWTSISLEFSDGSTEIVHPQKTAHRQTFKFDKKKITWIKIYDLVEDTDPNTFSSLTQIETFGRNVPQK